MRNLSYLNNHDNHLYPILAVTLGDPAGIGPDIFLKSNQLPQGAHLIVFGDPDLLHQRAKNLGLKIKLHEIQDLSTDTENLKNLKPSAPGDIFIVPIPLDKPVYPGQLSVAHSPYVLEALKLATNACLNQHCHAMVTGPVHKAILRAYDSIFIDQTHFISSLCQVDYSKVMMGFVSPEMRLGLATLHEPIQALSRLLTPELVTQKIEDFAQGLSDFFKIAHPKIGLLGFNPHAGEGGLIGQEEHTILQPSIDALNKSQPHYTLSALLSPDSAFISANRQKYDGFLAWYHDQGLTPFKTLYEQQAATLLFGLPILRTSVDHGTALALAGTDKADPSSFQYAIDLAITILKKIN